MTKISIFYQRYCSSYADSETFQLKVGTNYSLADKYFKFDTADGSVIIPLKAIRKIVVTNS